MTRPARGYAQVSLTRESEHRKRGSRRNGLMEADGLSRRQAGSRGQAVLLLGAAGCLVPLRLKV